MMTVRVGLMVSALKTIFHSMMLFPCSFIGRHRILSGFGTVAVLAEDGDVDV